MGEEAKPAMAMARPASGAVVSFLDSPKGEASAFLLGGAAGAYLWSSHRVLGFAGGAGLAYAAPKLATGRVGEAVEALVPDACAIGASLLGEKLFQKHPVLGPLGGFLAGLVVGNFLAPHARTAVEGLGK